MNGARADPWVKTISNPKRARMTKRGNSQYFFEWKIKWIRLLTVENLLIALDEFG